MPRSTAPVKASNAQGSTQLTELPEHLVQQFIQLASVVPDTESDGGASILEAILGATDVQDLDSPFDAKDQEKMVGVDMVIESITKSESDYADGLGIFLVIKSVVEETAEEVTWTCGSMSVIAQLVKAYTMDALPLRCKLVVAEKATKKGYLPLNLVISDNQPR